MKKFSIIVPIYNIEDYIEECILSVVNQSFDNYELILVDDGSPDNSGKVCDEYAKKNKNIKVIHKKNGGLSDARNSGIKSATGEYILFLDGDDTLYKDCLNKINLILNNGNIDLLSCNFCIYGNNFSSSSNSLKKINSLSDYISLFGDIPWSAWRNVYKREIFNEFNLEFEYGLIGAEDCEFFIRFFEKTKVSFFSDICLINYRLNRDGSITNKMSFNAIIGELNVFSKYFYKFYDLKDSCVYSLFANKYLNTITTINSLKDKDEINMVVDHINKNKDILGYSKGIRYSFAKIIWKLFGYVKGTKIIRFLKR